MGHLKVRVTPGSRDSGIGEWVDGVLRVKVREPAKEGRANDAVTRLLARSLGIPPSAIRLKRGASSREKLFEVSGLESPEIARRLGAPML